MSDSIKELLQKMNGNETAVVQGIVTSTNPIRISLVNDSVMDIPSSLIIVPEYLTKRTKTVKILSIDGTTENGGSGNSGDGGGGTTNSGGAGNTGWAGSGETGVCTIDGNGHFHYLGDHQHSVSDHQHSLSAHKHSLPAHKHDIKLQNKSVQIEIDDSLKSGEYVHLLSIGKGKIYYILGRV